MIPIIFDVSLLKDSQDNWIFFITVNTVQPGPFSGQREEDSVRLSLVVCPL